MKNLSATASHIIAIGLLTIGSSASAQTWISDANGDWDDPLNWAGTPPDSIDSTADFSTLDLGGSRIVTLDSSRTVGHLKFGDLVGNQNWTIATNGTTDAALTLAASVGTPSITVLNNGATNRLVLGGTQGFVKLGSGWLTLQGSTNVFTGTTIVSNGTLFLAKPAGAFAIPGDLEIHPGATVQFTTSSNQISDTSVVTIETGGTLNLANRPELIGKLILKGGVVTNTSGSPQLHATNGFEVSSGFVHSILGGPGQILTKTGSGWVTLTEANTYNGGTLIAQGTLQIGDGGTTGTAGATGTPITNNAQLVFNRGTGTALNVSGVISGSGSITKIGGGAVTLSGANTYNGTTVISNGLLSLNGSSSFGDGTGLLVLAGGSFNTTANRPAATAPVLNSIQIVADSAITTGSSSTTVDLNLTGALSGTAGTLTFRNDGANGATDQFDPRLSAGFEFNRPIVIDNGPLGLTRLNSFNVGGTTQIFNGPISGNGSFRKSVASGAGGVTIFNGANSYSGTTLVNAGELWVNGILGTNSVTVGSGGALGGTGLVHGAVQVQSGGTLSPGMSIGTLTISNTLALQAGSKTILELQASGACDRVSGLSAVNFGGTLQLDVTGALANGQTFQVFQASSYAGAFSSLVPATPGPGMEWNTNNLVVNGTLAVISTNAINAPIMTNVVKAPDRNLQFSISGTAGQNYRIWAATNLASGASWILLTNGIFESNTADFLDSASTNYLQRFYRVTIP